LLIDGDRSSNTSREDAGDGVDEASSCFEEAMKRCDALRRSETYLDFFTRAAPRAPAGHAPSRSARLGSSYGASRNGANMALRLAEASSQRIIGCGACGCWLLRDQDVLHEEERAARLTLDDSDSTVCVRHPNTKAVDGEFVINAVKKQRAHEDWAYTVRNAGCSQCGLFLGVEVIRTCEPSTDFAPVPSVIQSRAELLLWLLFETSRKHASISAPLSGWLRTQQANGRRRDLLNDTATQASHQPRGAAQRALGGHSATGDHFGIRPGAPSGAEGISGGASSSATAPRRPLGSLSGAPRHNRQDMEHDPESGAHITSGVGPGRQSCQGSLRHRILRRCSHALGLCFRRVCRHRHVVQTSAGDAVSGTPMGRRTLDDDGGISDIDIAAPQQGPPAIGSLAHQRMSDLLSVAERRAFGEQDFEGGLSLRRRGLRRSDQASGGQASRSAPHENAIAGSETNTGFPRTTDAVRVGQFFLGTRYLRLLDASPNGLGRRGAMYPVTRILCAGAVCSNTLSYADMILDCNRRWSLGDGDPERAMFMNTLCDGSYTARNCREHRLAQGLFDMADIHCKSCGWQVGYAFVRDKSEEKRNVNQVGRFGLVCSRVRLDAGTEVYVPSGRFRHSDNVAPVRPAQGAPTRRMNIRTSRQPSPASTTLHTL